MSTQQEIFEIARQSLEYENLVYEANNVKRIPASYTEPINDFLRHFLPDKYQGWSYQQIARDKTPDGDAPGLRAIHEAWDYASTFINTRAALDSPEGEAFKKAVVDIAMLSSGGGTFDNQLQNFMIGFDKYHAAKLPAHIEMAGPTFFTRPRLCLQSSNLRNNVLMLPLDTFNPNSLAFAIRALLDTNLANVNSAHYHEYATAIQNCPLINPESAWLTPFCNSLLSINGFPDISLQTETTDGGYFSEAQQYATGYDNFAGARYSCSCTFREIPGGVISAILFYWLEYIRCVTRGIMLAYPDDIDGQILNYTVSIYSFNLDQSQRYITRWVKCTGCFPTTLDMGSVFSKSEGQFFQDAASKVSTTFIVNKVEYMNPNVLMDFNTLAMRYCPYINSANGAYAKDDESNGKVKGLDRPSLPFSAFSNFCGLPYIVSDPYGYKLTYRMSDRDLSNDPMVKNLIAWDVARAEREWSMPSSADMNRYSLYNKYNYEDFYKKDVTTIKSKYNPYSFDKMVDDLINQRYLNR